LGGCLSIEKADFRRAAGVSRSREYPRRRELIFEPNALQTSVSSFVVF